MRPGRRSHWIAFAAMVESIGQVSCNLSGLAGSYGATAAGLPADADLERCFKAHAQQMEKPGLRNW